MRNPKATIQGLMHVAPSLSDEEINSVLDFAIELANYRNEGCGQKRCGHCRRWFRGPHAFCCWGCEQKALANAPRTTKRLRMTRRAAAYLKLATG